MDVHKIKVICDPRQDRSRPAMFRKSGVFMFVLERQNQ